MLKNSFILLALTAFACGSKQERTVPSTVTALPSPSDAGSAEPFLFTGADSAVYLSWIEKSKDTATFRFSSLQNGQWSEPITIASGESWFVNWADYPMLAASGNQFMAHILNKSAGSPYAYDIRITRSGDKGKSWSVPAILHDDNKKAEHGFVTILPYGDNFFVTWLDGRNTGMEGMEGMNHHEGHHGSMSLRAAVLDTHGNKLNEWELDNKTCDCCQTSAVITSSGPVVVYRDRSDEEIRDISVVRLVNGTWTEPQAIHHDQWKIAGCPVNGPRIASDGNTLAIAWFSAADTAHVNVSFSTDAGATFGDPIRVDEGNPIGRVDIELLNPSGAMVSWMEGTMIKAAKVNRDGTTEPSVVVANSSESRSSGFPQMTRAGNRLIFAWTDDQEKNIKVASLDIW